MIKINKVNIEKAYADKSKSVNTMYHKAFLESVKNVSNVDNIKPSVSVKKNNSPIMKNL